MSYEVWEIEAISSTSRHGGTGSYRVHYAAGHKDFYAKDEMDAYAQFQVWVEKDKKNMRMLLICGTVVILAILSSLTYSCQQKADRYDVNMRECVKAGKSYISEDSSYSCRDPFVRAKQ